MSLADIMLGDMTRFEQGTGEYKNNRARYYSMFAQDDYKISQRVSLNLGVRWEPAPPWREQVGRFQQFRLEDYENNVRSTLYDNAPRGLLFRGDPGVPFDGTNIDWMNIGTRVGVALDLTGDGKTSIRGGWGMFYDQQLDGEFYNVGVNSPPWSITTNITEPQGPFSDPYRGQNGGGVQRGHAGGHRPAGRGVPGSRPGERLRRKIHDTGDVQLQPHVRTRNHGGMDGARGVRGLADARRAQHHQREPGDQRTGRDNREHGRPPADEGVRRDQHLHTGRLQQLRFDAADAEPAVLERLDAQRQLHDVNQRRRQSSG